MDISAEASYKYMRLDNEPFGTSLTLDPTEKGAADQSKAGYAHARYAESLSEFGQPVKLPGSGGWLLQRAIAQSGSYDAMGLYPLFCCSDWSALRSDLDGVSDGLVSVAVVPDPFGNHDEALLRSCFDKVIPFKSHFVIDLQQPGPYGGSNHRYKARKALRHLQVEICANPKDMLEDWIALYGNLIERHNIKGIKAFSPESFRKQFETPGLVAFRASTLDGQCAGGQLWFWQGDVAYYHLGAANEIGYRHSSAYAIYATAIEYFADKARWLALGAGAGSTSKDDGLTRFKEGWANATREAFFCGRVLNPRRYLELTTAANAQQTNYFPAYRDGELS
jgi:GNAT acetyltransferase-like protein